MDSRIEIRPGRTLHFTFHNQINSTGTVFLIHGLGGSGEQWRKLVPFLKDRYNLVILDLLGHGQSDKPLSETSHNPYCFTELEQDLRIVFRRYAGQHNILIGHSYGGALAASLALDHQDQIQRMVLISPTPCRPHIDFPMAYHLPTLALEWIRPYLEKQFQRLAFGSDANPALIEEEWLAGKNNRMYVIKAVLEGMRDTPHIDATMLTVPTIIILGDMDKLIPPDSSRTFYSSLPHHAFHALPRTGHLSMLEQPNAVYVWMQDFLAKPAQGDTPPPLSGPIHEFAGVTPI